jgi:NitT/TauT family transport system ATP-binding protein
VSFLTIDHVTYGYKQTEQIIKDIEWTIDEGEFHSLVGKSGCGKTTLLKMAAGILQPDGGMICLKGTKVDKPSAEAGFVFQSPTLLEWKSVIENVLLPVSLRRKPRKEERERAETLLEMMGLSGFLNHYPSQLSGGQQSRTAIARALILEPAMLFMDEPFAALDAITREELQDDLLRICRMKKTSVLFITHDITEAVYLSDWVAVMEEGRIVSDLEVCLPESRQGSVRYTPAFNELCLQVRQMMSGQTV